MTAGAGTEWLRRKAHHAVRPMYEHTPDQQEQAARYFEEDERPWPRVSDIIHGHHLARGDGHATAPAVAWYGGQVRKPPTSRGSGLVPWYVPDGAAFEVLSPNSTATLAIKGEQPWTRHIEHELEDAELLAPYHWRADWLKQEEADDWDIPCRRPPMPGIEVDLTSDIVLEIHYRQMCEYKGWHYEPLISLPPEVDDDFRHAS